jgi:hypothetical protein
MPRSKTFNKRKVKKKSKQLNEESQTPNRRIFKTIPKQKIKYKQYKQQDIDSILTKIKHKEITFRTAHFIYDIPKSTLANNLNNANKNEKDKRRAFTDRQEININEEFLKHRKNGVAFNAKFISDLAKKVTEKKKVLKDLIRKQT